MLCGRARKIFQAIHCYLTVVLLMFTSWAVGAHQLSGTVYLGGEALAQAELTVYDSEDNPLHSAVTDAAGEYSVNLDNGTYRLIVTPPYLLGLSEVLIENVEIAGRDVLYHFVLLRPQVTLSGVVKNAAGTPVSGVELAIYNNYTGQNAGYVVTNASGAYSFPVTEGTYDIEAFGKGKNSNFALPEYWKIDPILSGLELSQDQIQDITLPVVTLSGKVAGANDGGVAAVRLSIQESWTDAGTRYYLSYNSNSLQTAEDGRYSLALFDNAQYQIALYPQLDSGYANTIVTNNVVHGDTAMDFFLQDAVYLSGKVLTPSGIAVSHVELSVYDKATGYFMGNYLTGENGQYTFPLPAGNYKMHANGYGINSNINLPRRWSIEPLVDQIPLIESRGFDVILPVVNVSGLITNTKGDPQSNVSLELVDSWKAQGVSYAVNFDENYLLSGQQGEFSFYTFAYDDYSLNLITNDRQQYATTQYSGLEFAQDTVRNFSLSGSSKLAGTVTTPEGIPVSGVSLAAIDQVSNLEIESIKTGGDGRYEFYLAPGLYRIKASGYAKDSNVALPQFWQINPVLKDLRINGIHEENIVLPLVQITGRIFDAVGNAVAGVQLEVKKAWSGVNGAVYSVNNSRGYVTTDEYGFYTISLFAYDNYRFELTPPAGSDLLTEMITAIDAGENSNNDLVFSPAFVLEGVVTDNSGRSVGGVNLDFISRGSMLTINHAQTNKQGFYHVALREDHYDINITESASPSNLPLPNKLYMAPIASNYPVANESTLDLVLPLVNLQGKAIDSNGVPIQGVQLLINERWKQGGAAFSVYAYGEKFQTNAQGGYEIALFPYAHYSEQIIPPQNSGFIAAQIDGFKLQQDSYQDIILSLPDRNPPLILSGPHVTEITENSALVQWQTNEASSGVVRYGASNALNQIINDTRFARLHSVVLTDLTPATQYQLNVVSDDYNHNGPVDSEPVAFRTLAQPDTQPPLILEGPSITAISQDSAMLSWATSEPTFATVRYGNTLSDTPSPTDITDSVAVGEAQTNHEFLLQGLQADTAYTVQVEVQDVAGNGPVQSPLKSFYTLAMADNLAPIIIAGPIVIDITENSAMVLWETDEPATSGVSYNDGAKHGLLSDDELVTQHRVFLSQLDSDTLYHFTVSSTDALGNGPVLSPQQEFTTAAERDDQPPLIIEGPFIVNITHQSVVIRWTTDKTADSLIEYGVSEDDLSVQQARSALVTRHNLPITGLSPGTTYYFQVSSADAKANRSEPSAVYSFRTDDQHRCYKPSITAAPQIVQLSNTSATVYWETDTAADSLVRYGSGDLHLRKESQAKSVQHQITLTNLTAGSRYQIQVASGDPQCDDNNDKTQSTEIEFYTQSYPDTQAPSAPGGIKVHVIDSATVEISWTTDEIADTKVHYNAKGQPLTKTAGSIARGKGHKIVLTNLSQETPYTLQVFSQDIHGNQYQSGVVEFNTKADRYFGTDTENPSGQGGGGFGPLTLPMMFFYAALAWHRRKSHGYKNLL